MLPQAQPRFIFTLNEIDASHTPKRSFVAHDRLVRAGLLPAVVAVHGKNDLPQDTGAAISCQMRTVK